MESRAKLFGHSIHQILIVFPLGLMLTSTIIDALTFVIRGKRGKKLAHSSDVMLGAGLFSGLIAAIFGLIDWMAIPEGTRAKRVGLMHAGTNALLMMINGVSWLMRRENPENPSVQARLLTQVGAGVAGVSGWFGGELVSRLGVGVYRGANLNASNTLSGRPAAEREREAWVPTQEPAL